jgi:transposase-like protein
VSRGGGFGSSASEGGTRAVPYLCPFCGEEDLRPTDGPGHPARWHCRSCLRVFSLTFHGLAAPETSSLSSARPDDLEE